MSNKSSKKGSNWKGNNYQSHVTHWDSGSNTRTSYDVKNDKSGGWSVSNKHSTDQNKAKGSPGRHK